MADILDLDNIEQNDMMNVFSNDTAMTQKVEKVIPSSNKQDTKIVENMQKESLSISANNIDDITSLLKKLLDNKTLEITIKIKD